MFKYKNDICEYIRLNTDGAIKKKIFSKYLDDNNLVLINKKTLNVINTIGEIIDLHETSHLDGYCLDRHCMGKADMTCVNCFLDYMLTINYLQLVKKEDKHA